MKFSVVVPLRNTPKEMELAKKSIPSIVRLNPSEIVIGMDKPVAESAIKHIEKIFEEQSFMNYKILQVQRSTEWNFQLANVVWHCYKSCKNDKIWTCYIDATLRSEVLKGYDIVGKNEVAVVSFTYRLLIKSVSQLIRYAFYRYRVRVHSDVFTGNYWIWRPCYFEDVDVGGLKKIQNGIDTYMYKRIVDRGLHKIVTLKDIGIDALDIQNEDMPWRQFQNGIWLYAHPKIIGTYYKKSSFDRIGGKIIRSMNRIMPFTVLARTICYQHPWLLRGWLWAKSHKNHKTVQIASELSLLEWGLTGAKHVKEIHNWERRGRTGTGFDENISIRTEPQNDNTPQDAKFNRI